MAVSTGITWKAVAVATQSNGLGPDTTKRHPIELATSFNAAGDKAYSATVALAATPTDLDLAGSLSDAFGDTITGSSLKLVAIKNLSASSGDVILVGAGTNPVGLFVADAATDKMRVPAGGAVMWYAGPTDVQAITGASNDLLRLDPGSDTFSAEILVVVGTG